MCAKRIHAPLRVVSYYSAMWHVWGMYVHSVYGNPLVVKRRTGERIFFDSKYRIHWADRKHKCKYRAVNRYFYVTVIIIVWNFYSPRVSHGYDREKGEAEIKRCTFNARPLINFIIAAMRGAMSTNHRICCCGFRGMRVPRCRQGLWRWRAVVFSGRIRVYGQIRSWRRLCNKLMSGKSNGIYGLAIAWQADMARHICNRMERRRKRIGIFM